jgi:hypothetical protein
VEQLLLLGSLRQHRTRARPHTGVLTCFACRDSRPTSSPYSPECMEVLNSRKFVSSILHKTTHVGTEEGRFPHPGSEGRALHLVVPYKHAAPRLALEGHEAVPFSLPSELLSVVRIKQAAVWYREANRSKGKVASSIVQIVQRFEHFLDVCRRPDGSRWGGQDLHNATGGVVTRSYVASLRKGRIENPGYEKLRAIAKAMGFPPQLWFEEGVGDGASVEPPRGDATSLDGLSISSGWSRTRGRDSPTPTRRWPALAPAISPRRRSRG